MYDSREGILASSYHSYESRSIISGNDALTLLEIVQQCLIVKNRKEFICIFPKLQGLFAFDFTDAILGYHDDKSGIVSDFGINVSMPKGWIREYMSKKYLQIDPVVKENFTRYMPQYWSDTKKRSACCKEMNSLYNDFGMREGYTHGSRLRATGKYGSKICFSSPSMKYDERIFAILEILVPHLHLALYNLYDGKQPANKGVTLTTREKEVLNWLKQGKTSWDISVILGISVSTVNYHVYNIMEKLGAANRPQAVAVASRMGLIEID